MLKSCRRNKYNGILTGNLNYISSAIFITGVRYHHSLTYSVIAFCTIALTISLPQLLLNGDIQTRTVQ